MPETRRKRPPQPRTAPGRPRARPARSPGFAHRRASGLPQDPASPPDVGATLSDATEYRLWRSSPKSSEIVSWGCRPRREKRANFAKIATCRKPARPHEPRTSVTISDHPPALRSDASPAIATPQRHVYVPPYSVPEAQRICAPRRQPRPVAARTDPRPPAACLCEAGRRGEQPGHSDASDLSDQSDGSDEPEHPPAWPPPHRGSDAASPSPTPVPEPCPQIRGQRLSSRAE